MKRRILYLFLAGISFFPTYLLQTQQNEDINQFLPQSCKSGGYDCGVKPVSREETETVPLSASNYIRHRGLPSKVDLEKYMPPPASQGQLGSCTAWASTYAIKSYHEHRKTGKPYDAPIKGGKGTGIFSPAFTYNLLNGGRPDGIALIHALRLLVKQGGVPWSVFPYSDKDWTTQPTQSMKKMALQYRAKSFERVTTIEAMKAELAKGNPILTAVTIYPSFMEQSRRVIDYEGGPMRGGHAIALIGYDDNKRSEHGDVGAFKFQNSWGPWYGKRGFGWISYKFFMKTSTGWGGSFVLYDSDSQDLISEVENEKKELSPPKKVIASQGTFSDKIEVSWDPVPDAIAYELERSEGNNKDFYRIAYSKETNYVDTAVQAGLSYRYRVIAIAGDLKSDASKSPIAEGYAEEEDLLVEPEQVTGLTAKAESSGKVLLEWTKQAAADYYQVIRYIPARNRWKFLSRKIRQASFTDTHPIQNSQNIYRVRAVAGGEKGEWSEAASVYLGGSQTPPSIVTGLEASMGDYKDKIVIHWDKVPGADSYVLFRYNFDTKKWDSPITVTSNIYEDNDPKIKSGKQFAYTVIAKNSAGVSPKYSEFAYGYADPFASRGGKIPAPKNVKGGLDTKTNEVWLKWDKVKDADSYYIFRKKDGEKKFQFIATATTNQYRSKFKGEAGQLYFYTVRSKGMLTGESQNSKFVAIFVNETLPVIHHRVAGDEGLEKFLGKWEGVYWTQDFKPIPIKIEISKKGTKPWIQYTIGNQRKATKGSFASGASVIRSKDVDLSLDPNVQDILHIEVKRGTKIVANLGKAS